MRVLIAYPAFHWIATFAVVCYLRDTFPAFSSKRRFKKLPRQMLEPLLE
jgi:hypothetical protein